MNHQPCVNREANAFRSQCPAAKRSISRNDPRARLVLGCHYPVGVRRSTDRRVGELLCDRRVSVARSLPHLRRRKFRASHSRAVRDFPGEDRRLAVGWVNTSILTKPLKSVLVRLPFPLAEHNTTPAGETPILVKHPSQ